MPSPTRVVMVGTYAPLAAFIKEARAAGLKSQLATVSFVGTDNLVSDVGTAGDGVVISQVVPFPDDNDLPIQRECREALAANGGGKLGFVNFEGCITRQGDGGRTGARRRPARARRPGEGAAGPAGP